MCYKHGFPIITYTYLLVAMYVKLWENRLGNESCRCQCLVTDSNFLSRILTNFENILIISKYTDRKLHVCMVSDILLNKRKSD